MMLDYKVIVVSDSTAAFSDEEHAGALNTFMLFFGDVMSTIEVIRRIAPIRYRKRFLGSLLKCHEEIIDRQRHLDGAIKDCLSHLILYRRRFKSVTRSMASMVRFAPDERRNTGIIAWDDAGNVQRSIKPEWVCLRMSDLSRYDIRRGIPNGRGQNGAELC